MPGVELLSNTSFGYRPALQVGAPRRIGPCRNVLQRTHDRHKLVGFAEKDYRELVREKATKRQRSRQVLTAPHDDRVREPSAEIFSAPCDDALVQMLERVPKRSVSERGGAVRIEEPSKIRVQTIVAVRPKQLADVRSGTE